jgi:lipopolysaccharide transport system ATP-binding protein
MSHDLAIEVRDVAKCYRLGASPQHMRTLRESLSDAARTTVRSLSSVKRARVAHTAARERRIFWALNDVNFSVSHGEVLGVIGRNGAGKSTLLKLLSRITEPTRGRITIQGRVASLLEVGTGFHPELSGRENIYLNGAILGMTRREIDTKFDEIVAFSDVERFVDTAVKYYSSGMYLRLAFSVAAHLEPEILLVDEVLAVGDMQFQKKCLGKMQGVAREGRTVLFVSHNMGAIKQLCTRAIYLEQGSIKADGAAGDVVDSYLQGAQSSNSVVDLSGYSNTYGNGELEVLSVALCNPIGSSFTIAWDQPIVLSIRVKAAHALRHISLAVGCIALDGAPMFTARSTDSVEDGYALAPGETKDYRVSVSHNLRAGIYQLVIGISAGNYNYYYHPSAAQLEISDVGESAYPYKNTGLVNCPAEWTECA